MATLLYKIGKWCAHHKGKVVLGWVTLIALVFISVFIFKPTFTEDLSIPGTPSESAAKILEEEFSSPSDSSDNGSARVVISSADSDIDLISKNGQETISEILDFIKKDNEVSRVSNPYEEYTISEDGNVLYTDVSYKKVPGEIPGESLTHIEKAADFAAKSDLEMAYSGDILPNEVEVGGISEVIGIVLAFVVLTVMFGSFIIAGLPIITALIGLLVSIGLTFIGTRLFEISSFSLSLSVMIGLAVGIDYALFIFSKHRQQAAEGTEIKESIARSTATGGSAVIFAGLTVIIALCGLVVIGIPFLGVMGITAALGVFLAVLVSVTAVPALLSILGERIIPKRNKEKILKRLNSSKSNVWGRVVTEHPWKAFVSSIMILIFVSIPATDLRLGLPTDGMLSEDKPERGAYDLLSEGFGEGFNGPLVVLLEGNLNTEHQEEDHSMIEREITNLDNVRNASSIIPSENGEYGIINVIPETGPNAAETTDLVHDIRDLSLLIEDEEEISTHVTGFTAINIDISEKLTEAIPIFASVIVGFAFILLLIVFRSILVPVTAVAGFLLTMTATLGFSVFILQEGNFNSLFGIPESGPILAFLPILVIGILFGLAMDYQVFLVTRMREEYLITNNPKEAILRGMKFSGPVVTAAGLIMVFVFAGFIFAPDSMIKSMGLALTFGVLFDAFIVRLTLIPALMKITGHSTWYLPKWLDKIIPNVDIEGHNLFKNNKETK